MSGHRLVVRNGYPQQHCDRGGPVEVRMPGASDGRVDEAAGERMRFKSSIPPWCRKSPKVAEVLPLMYLHGISIGNVAPRPEGLFGTATGRSSSAITRLAKQRQAEWDTERPPVFRSRRCESAPTRRPWSARVGPGRGLVQLS